MKELLKEKLQFNKTKCSKIMKREQEHNRSEEKQLKNECTSPK
jgi:hypothetical protein